MDGAEGIATAAGMGLGALGAAGGLVPGRRRSGGRRAENEQTGTSATGW
ncbi:hypothetical protein OHB00_46395 [Streptomyces sp. NBC_00631]